MKIKQVHFLKLFHKICSLLANFSLILHIFLPYLSAIPAYAEDPIPTPVPTSIVENSPTPFDSPEPTAPAVTETPAEPTAEPTAIPTGVDEVDTPEPTAIPTAEPTAIPTGVDEVDTPEPTAVPTAIPTGVDEVDIPEPTPTETVNIDIGTQTPVVETEVAPTAIPVIEKICLTGGEIIEDTTNENWIINDSTGISETKENVKLGLRYVYPQDSKVTIIFKCLPADESLRTPLKIQKIKTIDLKLPENVGNVGEYAYDITTGMSDGTFEYDVTLPKPDDSTAEVSYIEKSVDDATKNEIKVDEIKPIEESKTEQQSDTVKAVSIDHFSIYIVTSTGNAPILSTAAVNGQLSVTVGPYSSITVSLSVLRDSSSNWGSTRYQIGSLSWQCINHSDHNGNGTNTEEFIIQAPSTVGTYNLTLRASSENNCGGTVSSDYTMSNAITVQAATISTNPILPPTCGLDIALVLDNSTSINSSEMTSMKNAMTAFTNALDGTPTQFSVIHFATTATVDQGFSSNISTINSKINAIPVGGGYTNWDDGLRKAQSTLYNRSNPNLVIFASDGNPNTVGNGPENNASTGTLAVDAARFVANVLKSSTETTRILALGIGTDLNQNNMKQISGPSVGTSLTNDVVVVSSFTDLANQLKAFATESCGGSITVNKYYDQVDEAHRGGAGWIYNVAGTSKTTLTNGQTESVKVNSGTYTVTEDNMLSGYSYGSALCYKTGSSSPIGETTTKGIKNIPVGDLDIVYCNFVNYINRTDLSITKTDSPDPVNNGGTLTYTLTVNNLTTVPATNVIVNDTLPSGFSITSVTPSVGTCSDIVGPDIKCELGTLAGSASATVIVVGTVSTASSTITNSASVSTDTPETSTSNNSDSEDTVVNQKGHIIVQKTTVPAGDPTFFTTYLANTNGAHLTSGSVSDSTDYTFDVDAGTYKIVEDVPGGWGATSNPCLSGVTVAAGETKTCLIENKKLPVLTVEKVLVGDNSPYTNFSFKVDGINPTSFEADGNNSIYVVPGQTYTITEVDPGSNYNVSYSSGCTGNLTYNQTATCTITNTRYGSLTIVKNANPDSSQSFGFTTSGTGLSNFALSDDGIAGHSNSRTFNNLLPGSYSVVETADPFHDWDLTGVTCSDGSANTAINISAGENVTCTFTNTMRGNIAGQKLNDADGDVSTTGDRTNVVGWTIELWQNGIKIDDTLTTANGYSFNNLQPGIYELRESITVGWITLYPTSEKLDVTLSPGENDLHNDFINTKKASITVYKDVDSDGDGDVDITHSSDWTYDITGSINKLDNQTGTTVSNLTPGTYTVSEDQHNDYHVTSLICNNGVTSPNQDYGAVTSQSITLTSGQDLICTFTNAQKLGSLTVTKIVNWNGVVANGSQTFSICIKGPSYPTTANCKTITGSTGGDLTWSSLIPGDYTVTEPTVGSEWDIVVDHSSVSVPFDGGNATAQVTNTRKHGNLTITKVVNWSGITENTQKTFEICIEGPSYSSPNCKTTDSNGGDLTWSDLIPGDYTVNETNPGSEWNTVITTSPVAVPVDGSTGTATVTNTLLTGTITVVKNVLPSDDSGKFNLLINGTVYKTDAGNGDSTGAIALPVGNYYVTETEGTNTKSNEYNAIFSGACIDDDTGYKVSLSSGENKTCTITNTKKARIITKKVTIPSTSDQSFHFTSNWNTIPGFDLKNGESNDTGYTLTPNTYWDVREDPVPTGWDSKVSCDNGSPNDSIYVTPGQTVTCTFTNTKKVSLKIIKDSDPNDSQDFVFTLKDTQDNSKDSSTLDDDSDGALSNESIFTNIIPGNYRVYENSIFGWNLRNIICTNTTGAWDYRYQRLNVEIKPGEQPVCTFYNDRVKVPLYVSKFEDLNNNQTPDIKEKFLDGWTFELYENNTCAGSPSMTATTNGNLGKPGTASFENLYLGQTYWVKEVEQDGWTLTTGNCQSYTMHVDDNSNNQMYFGNQPDGSIYGYKWSDLDNSGTLNGEEPLLSGWTINLYKSNGEDGFDSTPIDSMITDSSQEHFGWYWFENLLPGQYKVCEVGQSGWKQTFPINEKTDNCHILNLPDDNSNQFPVAANYTEEGPLYNFGNQKFGKINVTKFNDIDGDGKFDDGEKTLSDWQINLTKQTSKNTDLSGQVIFDNLIPDTYTLSETMQTGWTQTNIWCEAQPSNEPTSTPTPNPTETPIPTPTDSDCPDSDGDRVCDSYDNCPSAANADQLDTDMDGVGDVCDAPITPTPTPESGDVLCHQITGNGCMEKMRKSCNPGEGWQEGRCPSTLNRLFSVQPVIAQEASTGYRIDLKAGQNVQCYIGNQRLDPQLTIAKENDTAGENRTPGSSVGFKIRVTVLNNDIDNLIVTDLPSNGFVYRPGTFKVLNLTSNQIIGITQPVYHSPGTWKIGDVKAGDVLELSYLADISNDQQPGVYKDLAYARGVADYDNSIPVIATSEVTGYVNNNLVGTDVPIVKETQNSVSAGVEKEVGGEVLGASTELPSTGANTIWLLISALMSLIGLAFIKKSTLKLTTLLFLVIFSLFSVSANAIEIDSLSVRLQQPKSPTNLNDLKLIFVALDLKNNDITVKCFKKGPSDSDYSQFGDNIPFAAPGNTSQCQTNSSILSTEGTYNFYVTANDEQSNIVSVDYKTSGPGTPSDYRKEWLNGGCDYKIHFKTADDGGKTVKVELYRADITSFILDDGSRVASINIGSNQEHDITNTVPVCDKDYYYVLRAFDDAGNGSGTIGDSVTITTSSTTTTGVGGDIALGAIPVINITLTPEEENALLTITPSPEENATNNEEGTVLGTFDTVKSFIQKAWLPLGLGLIALFAIIRYALKKKRKSYH